MFRSSKWVLTFSNVNIRLNDQNIFQRGTNTFFEWALANNNQYGIAVLKTCLSFANLFSSVV